MRFGFFNDYFSNKINNINNIIEIKANGQYTSNDNKEELKKNSIPLKIGSILTCKINFSSNKITFSYDSNEYIIKDLSKIFYECKFIRFGIFNLSSDNQIEILNIKYNLTLLDIDNPIKKMQ